MYTLIYRKDQRGSNRNKTRKIKTTTNHSRNQTFIKVKCTHVSLLSYCVKVKHLCNKEKASSLDFTCSPNQTYAAKLKSVGLTTLESKMRSPIKRRVKSTKSRGPASTLQTSVFNIYASSGNISLPSKEINIKLIEACDLRYYEHLALSDDHKDSVLVLWENEKHESPIRDQNNGIFDYVKNKQLNMEVHFMEGINRYRKLLSINFHLSGQKNAVVVSGFAAHDWIDFEYPVLKSLMQFKDNGCNKKRLLGKSRKEPFTVKITSNPGKRGKISTIILNEDETEPKLPVAARINDSINTDPIACTPLPRSKAHVCECSDGSDLSDDEDGSVYSDDASKSQSRNGLLHGATHLLKEIKSLKDETAKIREEKDDLQRKADFLTAKLIEIDQKIEFLETRANRLPSKCPANAVSTANPPPANPPPASSPSTNPPPESFEGEEKVTTSNESAAPNKSVNKEPSQKAWFNVCKNFNIGTCQRNRCRYEHKKVLMCKFFNSPTGCTKGLNCNFLHIKRRREENKPGSSKTMKPNEDQRKYLN